jgi:hypothetical protein
MNAVETVHRAMRRQWEQATVPEWQRFDSYQRDGLWPSSDP